MDVREKRRRDRERQRKCRAERQRLGRPAPARVDAALVESLASMLALMHVSVRDRVRAKETAIELRGLMNGAHRMLARDASLNPQEISRALAQRLDPRPHSGRIGEDPALPGWHGPPPVLETENSANA